MASLRNRGIKEFGPKVKCVNLWQSTEYILYNLWLIALLSNDLKMVKVMLYHTTRLTVLQKVVIIFNLVY